MYTTVILAMLGKIGAAAAYAVIYVWSAELYPTVVRNVGMGASSSCARIGGIMSPYIFDLVSLYHTTIGGAPEGGWFCPVFALQITFKQWVLDL